MAWQFLSDAARKQLDELQKVKVVLGNESCDLDSAASALSFAYLQDCIAKINPDVGTVIPVLNIPKEDFVMKTEVCYFLNRCNVPIDDLFFRDTIKIDELVSSGKIEVVLVDHHALSDQDICLQPYVTEVIDHRPLDPEWMWENVKKNMEIVGSCATLIAEVAITQNEFPIPQEILLLLYGTIILDTSCLSENPKKFTTKDASVLEELERRILRKPGRDALYRELLSVRCDITGLTNLQLLRKDMKVVSQVPVSTLPILAQDFLGMPEAEEEVESFAQRYPYGTVVMLGVSKLGSEVKREIAVYAQERRMLKMMTDCLTKSKNPNLQLQPIKKFSDSGKLLLYRQLNKEASRKQVVPLVKQAVINYEKLTSPSCSAAVSKC